MLNKDLNKTTESEKQFAKNLFGNKESLYEEIPNALSKEE